MLKNGRRDQIMKMISQLQHEAKQILETVVRLVYFMRGSVTYHQMLDMTFMEREIIDEFVAGRLEQERKNPHPNY